jgi:hypothetical protein
VTHQRATDSQFSIHGDSAAPPKIFRTDGPHHQVGGGVIRPNHTTRSSWRTGANWHVQIRRERRESSSCARDLPVVPADQRNMVSSRCSTARRGIACVRPIMPRSWR